jgi:hypothetical protein
MALSQFTYTLPAPLFPQQLSNAPFPQSPSPGLFKFTRWWLPVSDFSLVKSRGLQLACPWAECKAKLGRWQEWGRHILSHLPDCVYCPAPNCPWRGRRKEALKMHISNSKGKCGNSKKECMIYDANLVAKWIRENSVSIEIAEMFALNFVKEKAKELGKENLWTDLWRYDGAAMTNEISDRRHFGRGFADRSRCNCPYLRNNDDDTRPPPKQTKSREIW